MKKVKIVKQDFYYECGDGCCSEERITWYVDGEVVHGSSCEDSGWLAVLKHLGIEASLIGRNNEGEDIWEL